ncbi:gamma-glutamyltransferase family protein [Rahnella contaminans]|uniref:gamma-glutamyltransferase family protein n=1 Tax=Rahnella contaminans TaxID=2703882 RepID=UPI003C2B4EEF
MSENYDFNAAYPTLRPTMMGANAVCASQPLAAQAGMKMLMLGGNAADAAIATAIALTVLEPSGNGVGSDAFAIIWDGKKAHGLNASGRSPAAWTPEYFASKGYEAVPTYGWDAVTVPGAVSGWVALAKRFGTLPLTTLAQPAVDYARNGFPVSPLIGRLWEIAVKKLHNQPGFMECFAPEGRAPKIGEIFRNPQLADTLELIAKTEGEAFYRGELADKMIAHSREFGGAITHDDLANHKADWVETLQQSFAGGSVHELPPNGQGIATLIALGILGKLNIGDKPVDSVETTHLCIEAMKLALADLDQHVTDNDHMQFDPQLFLNDAYLEERARLIDRTKASDVTYGAPRPGGTVYLTTADSSGMMVSFIQSNYMGFGSGVVVPGTGISMQNRGCGFTLDQQHANCVAPNKRTLHTIIPAFAQDGEGKPLMSFGLMGGPMQAQGHLQLALRVMLYKQNPQAAIDAPRWRINGGRQVAMEATYDHNTLAALRAMGHELIVEDPLGGHSFGGAQVIVVNPAGGYLAGTESRKDGQALVM